LDNFIGGLYEKNLSLFVITLIVSGMVWVGGGSNKAQKSGVPTIVAMPKLVGIPYFNASETGAVQAGKDLGISVIYTGPATADAAEQVRMLADYISHGVGAICVAPNDVTVLTPVLRREKQAGIKVLDWDTSAGVSTPHRGSVSGSGKGFDRQGHYSRQRHAHRFRPLP
jgi:simple sugar transport system substrate-binding protein/rhamnose transport system substrate-binding protein